FPNCEKVVEMYKDGSFTVYADKKEYEVILSDDGTKIIYQEPEYIYEYNTGANEDIDEWSTPF
ncbi:hypothetical protein DUK53_16930, partial [Listeria sp. SHR_NRA_18]|uniref:hypothetical protein n=1 Tax=Listeria sp. SHR_NRA_18 TaxID=2269046 RepID=UPI000F90C450